MIVIMKVFRGFLIVFFALLAGSTGLCAQSVAEQIQAAEHSANLNTCLSGEYPSLCNHGLLRATEKTQVDAAEHSANLNTCLSGEYPSLCNHELLGAAGASTVAQPAHGDTLKAASVAAPVPSLGTGIAAPCAENGSCYGDISAATGNPKTVHVNGYYRKDGTYVRGYYRSAPRK
jgi:hypothetical protein